MPVYYINPGRPPKRSVGTSDAAIIAKLKQMQARQRRGVSRSTLNTKGSAMPMKRRRARRNPGGVGATPEMQAKIRARAARMAGHRAVKRMTASGKAPTKRRLSAYTAAFNRKYKKALTRAKRRQGAKRAHAARKSGTALVPYKKKSAARRRKATMARKSAKRVAAGRKAARTRKRNKMMRVAARRPKRRKGSRKGVARKRRTSRKRTGMTLAKRRAAGRKAARTRKRNARGGTSMVRSRKRRRRSGKRRYTGWKSLRRARRTIVHQKRRAKGRKRKFMRRHGMLRVNPGMSGFMSSVKAIVKEAIPFAGGFYGSKVVTNLAFTNFGGSVPVVPATFVKPLFSALAVVAAHFLTKRAFQKHRTSIMIGAGLNALDTILKAFAPASVQTYLSDYVNVSGVYDQSMADYVEVSDYFEPVGDYQDSGMDYAAQSGAGMYAGAGSLGAWTPKMLTTPIPSLPYGAQPITATRPYATKIPNWGAEDDQELYQGSFANPTIYDPSLA